MDKHTKHYFLRAMTGKSRLARLLDRALLCAAVYIIAYLWLARQLHNQLLSAWLAVLASGLVFCGYMLWFTMRLDRFTEKETARLGQNAMLEQLLLLPSSRVMDILLCSDAALTDARAVAVVEGGFAAHFPDGRKTMYALLKKHPAEPVTATELLAVYQRSLAEGCTELMLYSTAPYGEKANELVQSGVIAAVLHPPRRLLELARSLDMLSDEACVHSAVQKQLSKRKTFGITPKGSPKRYLLCAALLGISSFFTVYRLYYLVCAALCLLWAGIAAKAVKDAP